MTDSSSIGNQLSAPINRPTSSLNQTHESERSFTPFVLLTTDSSVWTLSESKHAFVYCIQCRQDSDCNFYLLLTQRDTLIQRDQVSAVSD